MSLRGAVKRQAQMLIVVVVLVVIICVYAVGEVTRIKKNYTELWRKVGMLEHEIKKFHK